MWVAPISKGTVVVCEGEEMRGLGVCVWREREGKRGDF